jgi:hypothetical protein
MADLKKTALVRLVPPASGGTRLFDVEVSSDSGESWARLGTQSVTTDHAKGNVPTLTIVMPAVGDAVKVAWEEVKYVPAPHTSSTVASG